MDVVIGNEEQDGIDFRLTLHRIDKVWMISAESLRRSMDLFHNPNTKTINRVKHIPYKIDYAKSNHIYYTLPNAIEYVDNIRLVTQPIAQLLLMYLVTELTWIIDNEKA